MREDVNQLAPKQRNTFVKQRAFGFRGRRFLTLFQPPFNKHGPTSKDPIVAEEKRVWDCSIREVRGHELLALAACKFTIERGRHEPEPFLITKGEARWTEADAAALFLVAGAQFPKAKPTDDYNFGADCEGKCELCQGVRKNNDAVAAVVAERRQARLDQGYEVEA